MLKKQIANAKEEGYSPVGALELEWFYKVLKDPKNPFSEQSDPVVGYQYTLSSAVDKNTELMSDTLKTLKKIGIKPEGCELEYSPS